MPGKMSRTQSCSGEKWPVVITAYFLIQLADYDQICVSPNLGPIARRLFQTPANSVQSERAFSTMNYIHSDLRNRLTTERAHKLQYIFVNKRALENMGPKKWTEEEMLLAKDMHIAEETERLEQNLMGVEGVEDGGDILDDDIPDEQDDDLVI